MSNQACLPKNTGLFFNGEFHKGDELLISRNPATGEDILEVDGASAETVDKVVGTLHRHNRHGGNWTSGNASPA